jgi:hypothetical protein
MFNAAGTAYAAENAKRETRFVLWFNGNGIVEKYWIPNETGSGYTMTPCLAPLASFRDQMHVVTGLDNPAASRMPCSVSTAFDDAELPLHDLGDLIVHRSDCPGFKGLQVRLCNLPSRGRLTTMDSFEAYQFPFRVQGNKGAQLRVSALGRASRQSHADDLLLIPPGVRVQIEWMKSVGRLAIFFLTPSFIGNIADQIGLPAPFLGRLPLSFSMNIMRSTMLNESSRLDENSGVSSAREAVSRPIRSPRYCFRDSLFMARDSRGFVTPRHSRRKPLRRRAPGSRACRSLCAGWHLS